MVIELLEQELRELRERKSTFSEGFRHKVTPEKWMLSRSLGEDILRLERALAAARGEPYAMEWPCPANWRFSVEPTPLVLTDGLTTLVLFESIESKPEARRTGVLRFHHCASSKLGDPNDEVIEGHPLYGKGIRVGGNYIVENSPWLEETRAINSVHPQYDPKHWRSLNHYLMFFKEWAFECLAKSVSGEVLEGSMRVAATQVLNALLRFP